MRHRNTTIFLAAAALSWAGGGLAAADERYVLQGLCSNIGDLAQV